MASTNVDALGDSLTIPVPTVPLGYKSGDRLFAFVYVMWDADSFGESTPIVTPEGWTQIDQSSAAFAQDMGDRFAVFMRISDGTEPASYDFVWGGDAVGVGRIVAERNVLDIRVSGIFQRGPSDPLNVAVGPVPTPVGARMIGAYAGRTFAEEWTLNDPDGRRYTQTANGALYNTFTDLVAIPGSDEVSGRLDVAGYLSAGGLTSRSATVAADGGMAPADQIGFGVLIILS